MEIEIVVPTLAPPPTIIPQTTEVLSQVSKGIRLGALGLRWWSGPKRTHNGPYNRPYNGP